MAQGEVERAEQARARQRADRARSGELAEHESALLGAAKRSFLLGHEAANAAESETFRRMPRRKPIVGPRRMDRRKEFRQPLGARM
jgi:hypothetical protein